MTPAIGVIGQNIVIDCGTHEDALRLVANVTLAPTPPDDLPNGQPCRCIPLPPDGRCGCPCHGWEEDKPTGDLRTLAPTPPDALDVERLARAIRTVEWKRSEGTGIVYVGPPSEWFFEYAGNVIDEYAALQPKEADHD